MYPTKSAGKYQVSKRDPKKILFFLILFLFGFSTTTLYSEEPSSEPEKSTDLPETSQPTKESSPTESAKELEKTKTSSTPDPAKDLEKTSLSPADQAALLIPPVDARARLLATQTAIRERSEAGGKVIVVKIEGTIDLGLAPYIARVVEDAEEEKAAVIILDIDTFGGRVDAAVKIRDVLLESKTPIIAFVHPRAISAGALISLAADVIVVTNGSTIGAATPIQMGNPSEGAQPVSEKVTSYLRGEFRATANKKNRRGDLAEAMVDMTIVIPGVDPEDKLVSLTGKEAMDNRLAELIVNDMDQLLSEFGIQNAPVQKTSLNWSELIARFLTDPAISSLLMSFGFLGILIEFYTPGFGWAGGLGILFLGLFYFGHFVVYLAGAEELLLLLAGFILLVVEIFVIPGFGAVGIAGLICISVSLVLSLNNMPLDISWEMGSLQNAMMRVGLSLFGTLVLSAILLKFMPHSRFAKFLVLDTKIDKGTSKNSGTLSKVKKELDGLEAGLKGICLTDLRPFGKVRFDTGKVEVKGETPFIAKGSSVVIIRQENDFWVVDPDSEN